MAAPPSRHGIPFEIRMALRYLTPRKREGLVTSVTVLCAAGVLVGVAALVLALALMGGLHGQWTSRLLASNPHVVIRPAWGTTSFGEAEARALERLASEHPDVVGVSLYCSVQGLLRSRLMPAGMPVVLRAIDPERESRVTHLQDSATAAAWTALRGGARPAGRAVPPDAAGGSEEAADPGAEAEALEASELLPPEPPAVLLGQGLAMELGVNPGDLVHLVTTAPELSVAGAVPRSRALKVAGLLATGYHEYDQGLAVVSLESRRGADGTLQVDGLQVAVRDPLEAAAAGADLLRWLDGPFHVTDWTTTFSRLFSAFRWEKLIMTLALGLIGVVAGFNIFTILTMNVMARVPDIGILCAIGTRPETIARIFLWMGLGLGGAGTAFGLALGTIVAVVVDRFELIRLDESVYQVSHVPLTVDAADLAFVAFGMLLVSLLSTLIPARCASRVDPIVALRAGG